MSWWETITDWTSRAGPYIDQGIKALTAFLFYTAGRKKERDAVEKETAKAALGESDRVLEEREKIREKYDKLRSSTPDDWESLKRLRGKPEG